MFPAVVRYDECERGMVEHAVRLVVYRTRVGQFIRRRIRHRQVIRRTEHPGDGASGCG